ncbi:hypothetical protein [Jeotgalibacillus salarius]|uniref:Uncharacterized protein n=1 Tax=Jeotgalibacillus salarius TaxID=546023 RepID=A0A4Y8LBJ6_9BACL|nr:hypothetical protein [Jeotgalibacillus salarius]TFD99621.1 hypothetical protein E2626_13990 [Jeotgalibacillus salarius]
MRTVLFLVHDQLSSCSLLGTVFKKSLKKNGIENIVPLLRGTFAWHLNEMSENSFRGNNGSFIEEEMEIKQLQRSDLEQAEMIVIMGDSVEDTLKHLLKAASSDPSIIKVEELGGKSVYELERALQDNQTDKAVEDVEQKSLALLEML